MKIVVAYKWAANPQDAVVAADGSIDWSRAKPGVSDYDTCAVELARRIAADTGSELVGVSVGGPEISASMACKAPLSRGIDRLTLVSDEALKGADSVVVGKTIAEVVKTLGDVALVVMGDSSVDRGSRLVPGVTAAALDWPVLTGITAVTRDGDTWSFERASGGGTQTVSVAGAAVMSAAGDAVVAPVPSMKEILGAGKKPTEVIPRDSLPVVEMVGTATVIARAKPELAARKGVMIDGSDGAEAANQLVDQLRSSSII